jgi:hypothetical protein
MKGIVRWAAIVVATLAVGLFAGWFLSGGAEPRFTTAPPMAPPPAPEGQNGLSDSDRTAFYHLSEGGELFPVDLVLALEQEYVADDGSVQLRPFLDNIERYGLLPDPKRPGNEDGLPVGVSLGVSKAEGIEMIGLNCAACHVGQVQYNGRPVRIDGLGNMVVVNDFLRGIVEQMTKTTQSPQRLARFWKRLREVREERRKRGVSGLFEKDERPVRRVFGTSDRESALRRVLDLFTRDRPLLDAQLDTLRTLPSLVKSIEAGTQPGYGRLDAFGIGRDELFGPADPLNYTPPSAPVSLPHIWGFQYTGWLQWGANTNSVMERNIGQSLGVGTLFNAQTFDSSVRINNLHRLEQFAYKIAPPQWPAAFPPVNADRASHGKGLFEQHCAPCHEQYTVDGVMRIYKLFPLSVVATDPMTAINFELPVREADGLVRPFPGAALDLITRIKQKAYAEAGYTDDEIDRLEERQIRSGSLFDPTFRAPMRDDGRKYSDTKDRSVYRAKSLVGIWATAPYLHNGSVPTIYDLLKPAADRPATFTLGTREYDPVKLGIQTNAGSAPALAPGQHAFEFDTKIAGNWNTGHEWSFYPSLTDDDRYAIIEFLKTFTSEAQLTASATTNSPTAPPDPAADKPIRDRSASARGDSGLNAQARAILALAALILIGAGLFVASWFLPQGEAARTTETEDTALLTQNILTLQRTSAQQQNRRPGRGTHTKGMAVRAEFEVFDVYRTISDRALASRLACGLFAKPGIYNATVRFANAASFVYPDPKADIRACSVAVEVPAGVLGPEPMRQDFAMNNGRVFPLNDTRSFAMATVVNVAPSMLRGFLSLKFRDKMQFLRSVAVALPQTKSAKIAYQQLSYWSTVPFHHGPADVIKYGAFACPGNYAEPLSTAINCLQDELARHVNDDLQMSCFDIGLQLLDADKMTYFGRRRTPTFWIENATVTWKESQAPFHTVGRLTLVPKSVFSPDAVSKMYVDVTTNSAADSKPMGGINRARPVAEEASRRAREHQRAPTVASV